MQKCGKRHHLLLHMEKGCKGFDTSQVISIQNKSNLNSNLSPTANVFSPYN